MAALDKTALSHGFLLDGESPVSVPVRIVLLDTSLRVTSIADRKMRVWEFTDLDWEATRTLGGQLRIKRLGSDQWLVVTAPDLIATIAAEGREWRRRNFWLARPDARAALTVGVTTIVLCVTLWFSWPWLVRPVAALMPQSARNWLGNSTQQMVGLTQECTDPAGRAALETLTARLTQKSPELRSIQVLPVQSTMVNAIALANDKVVLTSALIKQAQSPDEIAGILAHEFGHVAHGHVLRNFLGQAALQMLITLFTGVHGADMSRLNTLTGRAHSRAFEAEADAMAIKLLKEAQISTQGLAEFFSRTAQKEGVSSRFSRYFATHPATAEREKLLRGTAVPQPTPALNLKEWEALKRVCGESPAPAPPRAVPPSLMPPHPVPLPRQDKEL